MHHLRYSILTTVYGFIGTLALILNPRSVLAVAPLPPPSNAHPSMGEVFGNLFGFVLNIQGLLETIMIVTGTGLVLGAIIRYQKFRRNPVETPLSSVFILLLVAVVLFILAIIPIQADDSAG